MIGEINQNNVHLLIPSKLFWLAPRLAKEKGISLIEAITMVYSSDTYKMLAQEDTKKWHWSPVDLYNELISSIPIQE
ncbi:MAG: hypothetical protein LUC37_06305 [Prevotella sp.]|nr:hypothetical protein [Prevotella sp.]